MRRVGWQKGRKGCRGKHLEEACELLFVLFLLTQHFFLRLAELLFFLFFARDDVELNRVELHDFEFRFALRAAQDFTFLDLVFVNVQLGGAFRTPNHGENLLCEESNRIRGAYYITPPAASGKRGQRVIIPLLPGRKLDAWQAIGNTPIDPSSA
jgi:hypothetical protein